jgi:BirA family biotin operon repressor/biotin-[acetyl-CoA-carboxylase] ligase
VSFLFRSGVEEPHRLTQMIAVAALQACEQVAGVAPVLKWPNDLLLDGAKLAGILAQAGGEAGRIDYVVVGLGLNVRWAPPGAALLGDHIDPADVLNGILGALDALERAGPDAVHRQYRARLATLGTPVRVELPDGELTGIAVNVQPDGRLVVQPSSGAPARVFDTGDVVHLRTLAD